MSALESLAASTTVVVDSSDLQQLQHFGQYARDTTTNPSLLLKAYKQEHHRSIIQKGIDAATAELGSNSKATVQVVVDHILCCFAGEILKLIPGRVSVEVDARLSFDTTASVEKGRRLVGLLSKLGYGKERVLVKLAATWEGVEAARVLQSEGINCNMTLIFSLTQAVECAKAGVKLISPFVGRILDWHKAKDYEAHEDPGVLSVKEIWRCYKGNNIQTEVMAASFRNTGEIKQLAGLDLLTVSPGLLQELQSEQATVPCVLSKSAAANPTETPVTLSSEPRSDDQKRSEEASFRFAMNENAMATEKLAEGIRVFSADMTQLEMLLIDRLALV